MFNKLMKLVVKHKLLGCCGLILLASLPVFLTLFIEDSRRNPTPSQFEVEPTDVSLENSAIADIRIIVSLSPSYTEEKGVTIENPDDYICSMTLELKLNTGFWFTDKPEGLPTDAVVNGVKSNTLQIFIPTFPAKYHYDLIVPIGAAGTTPGTDNMTINELAKERAN